MENVNVSKIQRIRCINNILYIIGDIKTYVLKTKQLYLYKHLEVETIHATKVSVFNKNTSKEYYKVHLFDGSFDYIPKSSIISINTSIV